MQANRDSIMKPQHDVIAAGHGRNRPARNLRCRLIDRRYALHLSFIKKRFMLAS
jgi:hypothetical protein